MIEFSGLLTSNSADLRNRNFQTEFRPARKGKNMYPAPGGFIVRYNQFNLKIFTKFPVGVGFGGKKSFEILLHRNPSADDSFSLQ